MDKEGFKVGDKGKLRTEYVRRFRQRAEIGEVMSFNNKYVRVSYEGYYGPFPYRPHEIERVVRVGEQLEFNFMKGD